MIPGYFGSWLNTRQPLHVVSVSGGVPSAVTAIRVVQRYGRQNTRLVYADTEAEHDDNYRFLKDVEEYLGKTVHGLSQGKTPHDLMDQENTIFNQRVRSCTRKLKIEPIERHVRDLQEQGHTVIVHIGMDLQDQQRGRLGATRRNWQRLGVEVQYPLIEWENPCTNTQAELQEHGLIPPVTYSQGFVHANCVKSGCVCWGKKDWKRFFELYPENYREAEHREYLIRNRHFTRHVLEFRAVMAVASHALKALYLSWFRCSLTGHENQRVPKNRYLHFGDFRMYAFLRDNRQEYPWDHISLRDFRRELETAQATNTISFFTMLTDLEAGSCGSECGVYSVEKVS